MRFSLETQQRDFFRKNHAIELEGLLSSAQLSLLQEGIFATRPKNALAKEVFLKSRDLWRVNDNVKKVITNHNLAELAYQLDAEKPIRLGFDQLLPAIENSRDEYPLLFKEGTIEATSCVKNLLALLIICVSGEGKAPEFETGDPFPSSPGNGVYLSPDYQINYQNLLSRKNQTFMMVGFAGKYSQYLFVVEDPQVHALKKLGYVFGDTLNDSLHPILLR